LYTSCVLGLRLSALFNELLLIKKKYFIEHGIIHRSTYIDTPKQNGVTKHKYQYLLEVI
jgi:hypothetical protein